MLVTNLTSVNLGTPFPGPFRFPATHVWKQDYKDARILHRPLSSDTPVHYFNGITGVKESSELPRPPPQMDRSLGFLLLVN